MLIFIVVVIGLAGLAAYYAWIARKDMRAQREDDELHLDPWED